MGIREALKDKSRLSTAVFAAVAVGIAIYIAKNAVSGTVMPSTQAYFTTDDGQTQFIETMDHLAPFDHQGKEAVRVWMFSTDGGKTKFPGYLDRYTPQAKSRIEPQMADFKSGKSHMLPQIGPGDTEVKKPGAGNPWVNRSNLTESQKIVQPQVPAGADVEVQMP